MGKSRTHVMMVIALGGPMGWREVPVYLGMPDGEVRRARPRAISEVMCCNPHAAIRETMGKSVGTWDASCALDDLPRTLHIDANRYGLPEEMPVLCTMTITDKRDEGDIRAGGVPRAEDLAIEPRILDMGLFGSYLAMVL